jgi:predicted enzyme related to lactoylglutathione lyase
MQPIGGACRMIARGEGSAKGRAMQICAGMIAKGAQQTWIGDFHADDVEASAFTVHGGQVLRSPRKVLDDDRPVIGSDPQGAGFATFCQKGV